MEQELSRNQQQLGSIEMQNLITSHLEASKIGRHIADTVMDSKKKRYYNTDSSPSHTQHDIIAQVKNNLVINAT